MPLGSHEALGRKDIMALDSSGLRLQLGPRCCCKGLDAAPSERFTSFLANADRMLDAQGVGIIPMHRAHFPTSEATISTSSRCQRCSNNRFARFRQAGRASALAVARMMAVVVVMLHSI